MTLAYLVLAHRNPGQLARLCDRLTAQGDFVFVHIDRKMALNPFQAALHPLITASQVQLLSSRKDCHWGGYGHVDASFAAIDAALQQPTHFSHLVLMTGQDYPIKPLSAIRRFFSDQAETSFLSWASGGTPRAAGRTANSEWVWDGDTRRMERHHLRLGRKIVAIPNDHFPWFPKKRLPRDLLPHQGLAYWSLTPRAASYVRQTVRQRPDIERFFRTALIPDENIFQMILLSSVLRTTLINDDLRFITWEGFHPRTLGADALDALLDSEKLFARKFDVDVDSSVLDEIDVRILGYSETGSRRA